MPNIAWVPLAVVPVVPDLAGALPDWTSKVGVVGIIFFFGLGLARNWFFTSGQVNHLITQYEKVAALWEKVAAERQETIKLLTDNNEAVLRGNEAILRAVEELQRQQEYARQQMPRRPEGNRR